MNEITIVFKNGKEVSWTNASVRLVLTSNLVLVRTMNGVRSFRLTQVEYILRDGTVLNLTGQF